MNTRIFKSRATGCVAAPPSKSYAHRMLIASFLASLDKENVKKNNSVSNILLSDDIKATLGCLKALGANFIIKGDSVVFKPAEIREHTGNGIFLDCNESASTLRFFIPIALVLMPNVRIIMCGTPKLMKRGLEVYEHMFQNIGVSYEHGEDFFSFCGELKGDEFVISLNKSSQYFTGMAFALSLKEKNCRIIIDGNIESYSYVCATLDVLSEFGIKSEFSRESREILIFASQHYIAGCREVEGDFSNAAFFEALNYVDDKNTVKVSGLKSDSVQGDKAYLNLFPLLKNKNMPVVDVANCIDLGPVLFMLASVLNGAEFIETGRLRIKESDRVLAMIMELQKFGAKIDVQDSNVIVHRTVLHDPVQDLSGHNDHRIVMALCILLTKYGGVISGSEAINKSFPTFFEKLRQAGVKFEHF